jgi:hypothetical protein
VAIQAAQRGEAARHAPRPQPAAAEREEVVAHVARGERAERAARPFQVAAEIGEVATVGEHGVARGPSLSLEGLKILHHRVHHGFRRG